jgi:hypothetical protein
MEVRDYRRNYINDVNDNFYDLVLEIPLEERLIEFHNRPYAR